MTWALLCDMDGTLIDSEPLWHQSEQTVISHYGGHWREEYGIQLTGKTLTQTVDIMIELSGITVDKDVFLHQLLQQQARALTAHIPWFDGAKELLAATQQAGGRTALVSSSYRQLVDPIAQSTTYLDVSVAGDEVEQGKPHPEPYLAAAKKCGVPINKCIVLEDSPSGVASGNAAGATVVAVGNEFSFDDADVLAHIPHIGDISVPWLQQAVTS